MSDYQIDLSETLVYKYESHFFWFYKRNCNPIARIQHILLHDECVLCSSAKSYWSYFRNRYLQGLLSYTMQLSTYVYVICILLKVRKVQVIFVLIKTMHFTVNSNVSNHCSTLLAYRKRYLTGAIFWIKPQITRSTVTSGVPLQWSTQKTKCFHLSEIFFGERETNQTWL